MSDVNNEFHSLKKLGDSIVSAGESAIGTKYRMCVVTNFDVSGPVPLAVCTLDPSAPAAQQSFVSIPWMQPYHPSIGEYAYVEEYPGRGMVIVGGIADKWHLVGSGGAEPAFSGTWVNYGLGYQALRFTRLNGRVWIEGTIKNGTNNTIFFGLPSGWRPVQNKQIWCRGTTTVQTNDTYGLVTIDSLGNVVGTLEVAAGVASGSVTAFTVSGWFGMGE